MKGIETCQGFTTKKLFIIKHDYDDFLMKM